MDRSNRTIPASAGQTITENGTEYFVIGKTRIKITEHFSLEGKRIEELVTDLITQKIKENTNNLT